MHAAGVVHRDLKPANVLINAEGEPVLIDFGIAHVLDATRLTLTGTFLGTPSYAAPELFADEPVGEPADVHAWAATVAFAATGRPTFGGGTVEAQMYAILNGHADLEGVPAALLPLIRAALHREAAKRPTAALLSGRIGRLARATLAGRASSKAGRPVAAKAVSNAAKKPESRPRPGAEEPARGGRSAAKVAETARGSRSATGTDEPAGSARGTRPAPGEGTSRGGRQASVAGESPRSGRQVSGTGESSRSARQGPATGESSRRARAASTRTGSRAARKTPKGGQADGSQDVELAAEGRAGPLPTGNASLLLLAVLALPCVVATVIWPPVTFAVTGSFVVLARALWTGHWLVRKRRSARTRAFLRVLNFPVTFVGALVTGILWPGLPAAGLASTTLWLISGGSPPHEWWQQPAPVAVSGIVFGVVCGGLIGREIERIGSEIPELRKEGLRALAVLGGFVALCSAAVRAIALLI
ncbi:serine/threonine-protein kinase [Streptosporangium lutulentum]